MPHAAIILATSATAGEMGHITTKSESGNWVFKFGPQGIAHSLSLTSLIRIRDSSKGAITKDDLEQALAEVSVPD